MTTKPRLQLFIHIYFQKSFSCYDNKSLLRVLTDFSHGCVAELWLFQTQWFILLFMTSLKWCMDLKRERKTFGHQCVLELLLEVIFGSSFVILHNQQNSFENYMHISFMNWYFKQYLNDLSGLLSVWMTEYLMYGKSNSQHDHSLSTCVYETKCKCYLLSTWNTTTLSIGFGD